MSTKHRKTRQFLAGKGVGGRGRGPSLLRRGEKRLRQGHGQGAPGRIGAAPPAADPPPNHPRPTPCQLKHLQFPVYFACDVQKHRFFNGVSGPSAARDFILAMLQNLGFYVVLGSRGGPGRKKLAS